MTKFVDLSHIVFLDLLQHLVDTSGTKVAKGNLMRIAMNVGEHLEPVEYADFDAFLAASDTGDTPFAQMEGKAIHLGDGVFGLAACPFGQLARNYRDFFDKDAADFHELTGEFNAESKLTRDFKVGLGAGVGPFCIFHQPMRSKAQNKITIAGKPIEIYQLACKSASGKVAYADSLIEEFGCNRNTVESAMETYLCCYGVKTA